jgi:CDP-diacylglycerol--serine O-phosphatidyltransferase
MRQIIALPNLLTLANAFCGLLAISKGIDAMAVGRIDAALFYAKMESACWLIFLGMIFDALDGRVARMTGGSSGFGAQLDSFSDFLTFGCAPALLAKALLEFEAPLRGYTGNPRLHFLAAAGFALMALLRLARFNLETEQDADAHKAFSGLPSPAAAGAVASTMLFYLVMRSPELETVEGTPTPFGRALSLFPEIQIAVPWWTLPCLAMLLPILGFLMVSRVHYAHAVSVLTRRGTFFTLVYMVFGGFLFFAAPIPILFIVFHTYVISGVVRTLIARRKARLESVALESTQRP